MEQKDMMTRFSQVLLLLLLASLTNTTTYSFLVASPIACPRGLIGCYHKQSGACQKMAAAAAATPSEGGESPVGSMEKVLFVEVGFGNDQHGQDPTKACVRACRNAIEFNSIPSINSIVPGGYANMKLRVQLAVPVAEEEVDVDAVRKVFPYGQLLPVEFQRGGMRASSGIELPEMGDHGDDMIIAISCITVGY